MKGFHATYYDTHGYGTCTDYDAIVIAEDKLRALGWCLQYYPDTVAKNWDFDEIDLTTTGVTHIQDGSR